MNAISIVLTIYKTEARILRLLADLRATLENDAGVSLVVVNDCSPSKRAHTSVLALKVLFPDRVRYLRNKKNRGYLPSVQKGIAATNPRTDLVLLNCDTRVCGDWCRRLQQSAYSEGRIASAMPLTNNLLYASVWTPPQRSSQIEKQTAFIDQYFSAQKYSHHQVPSTFGFCMFIKRKAWSQVGKFNDALFYPGYGEEVDWCFRARNLGLKHILSRNVFVYHHGGASFSGPDTFRLQNKSSRILKFVYPDQWREYLDFLPRRY